MLQIIIISITENWTELATIILASVILFYARRADHSSKGTVDAARESDLTNLKISAESNLAEAGRNFNYVTVQL